MRARTSERRTRPRRLERLVIECVSPQLDAGRYPVKRVVGDLVWVGADVVNNSQDQLAAHVVFKEPAASSWTATPLVYDIDTDRWYGGFRVDSVGRWLFTVEAWTDRFSTWYGDLQKKRAADVDVSIELLEGAALARSAARGAVSAPARATLLMTAKALENSRGLSVETRVSRAVDEDFLEAHANALPPERPHALCARSGHHGRSAAGSIRLVV